MVPDFAQETKQPMGIGRLGDANLTIKRKFRWTFEITGFCSDGQGNVRNLIPQHFVKVASRPNLSIEETELNHLNAKTWIPGKASWETITVTYIDVAHMDQMQLWQWLATVYDFTSPITLQQGEKRNWDATGQLYMYDGYGNAVESWQLLHMFPTAINFGDLDYSSSEEATIELTLRYSDVTYTSLCPNYTPEGCFSPCVGS